MGWINKGEGVVDRGVLLEVLLMVGKELMETVGSEVDMVCSCDIFD